MQKPYQITLLNNGQGTSNAQIMHRFILRPKGLPFLNTPPRNNLPVENPTKQSTGRYFVWEGVYTWATPDYVLNVMRMSN